MNKIKSWFASLDKQLLSAVLLLIMIGVSCIGFIPFYQRFFGFSYNLFLYKTLKAVLIGVPLMMWMSTLSINWIKRITIGLGGFVLLWQIFQIFLLSDGLYSLFELKRFAPFILPGFIVGTAAFLNQRDNVKRPGLWHSWPVYLIAVLFMMLILLMTTNMLLVGTIWLATFVILFVVGLHKTKTRALVATLAGISVAGICAIFHYFLHVHSWFYARFIRFFTEGSVSGGFYQTIRAQFVLRNANLIGGNTSNAVSIPNGAKEFIFASATGYFGYIFALLILVLLGFVFYKLLVHIRQINDRFAKYTIVGVLVIFTLQTLIHLTMNIGLLPPMNAPLPFVSYGPTMLSVYCLMFGIVLALTQRKK